MRVGLAKSEIVARTLEHDIRGGRVGHGQQLDSEGALMQRFAVSRNTVRRGLELLARQGLITTRTGIGSFVTYEGTTIDSSLGWSVALSQNGGRVETRLLDIRKGECAAADSFLNANGPYLCVDRARFCQDAGYAISLERSRLPWRTAFASFVTTGLSGGSLHQSLAKIGLHPASGAEVASVIAALSPTDAAIMQRAAGEPMLRLQRETRTKARDVLEYVDSILDPSRFGLRIVF
jgi:GntR family transcriptional regulator